LVKELIEQLIKGKLRETSYPFLGNNFRDRPQEIIVFIIGGITYEETLAVNNINKAYSGNIKVIIGGTNLHNFKSFIDEVLSLTNNDNEILTERRQRETKHISNSLASAMKDY
jgi:vacuolar protein sorting-associated protein 45